MYNDQKMIVLDGKKIAAEILDKIKQEVSRLNFKPVFCDIQIGDDPASAQYVRMKAKTAEKVGMKFLKANFPKFFSTDNLIEKIKIINQEPGICGLIVQLPLPAHFDRQRILNAINPKIDVDCTGEVNANLFYEGRSYVEFPTAAAVMSLLDKVGADFSSKKFLVIGYGQLVGRPVSFLLKQRGYEVDVARSKTENIEQLIKSADVIISAAGKPKLVTGEKIKNNAIIIDAGTSESEGGIVGDVDFESVKEVAYAVSPVPGGVGPVTVAKLLQNVLKVAKT